MCCFFSSACDMLITTVLAGRQSIASQHREAFSGWTYGARVNGYGTELNSGDKGANASLGRKL